MQRRRVPRGGLAAVSPRSRRPHRRADGAERGRTARRLVLITVRDDLAVGAAIQMPPYPLSLVLQWNPHSRRRRRRQRTGCDTPRTDRVRGVRDTAVAFAKAWHSTTLRAGTVRTDRFVLWEIDGDPVSMAVVRAPTSGASRIGLVYTPPDRRGHGYGSVVSAAALGLAHRSGTRDVVLFADLTNPLCRPRVTARVRKLHAVRGVSIYRHARSAEVRPRVP